MSLKTTVTSDDEGKQKVMAIASGSMFGTCFLALPAIFSTLVHISKQIRCRTQSSLLAWPYPLHHIQPAPPMIARSTETWELATEALLNQDHVFQSLLTFHGACSSFSFRSFSSFPPSSLLPFFAEECSLCVTVLNGLGSHGHF